MSILTCEEAVASLSSSNNMNNEAIFYPSHEHQLVTPQYQNSSQQIKKKRNQPGNPDPEAEVIALSPKSLVATNRFFCEICNKGFQRDQNLQLHRRGHNLPWKLKKKENKEVARKKVYVCPESSCVHHDPLRALGDLTGIKKHFSRKHGEKKWKCEKCSKRYAVQSDCKAHFKTCGTREYKCECGTIFSRRDNFITHRAFCETLAVESAKLSANTPTILSSQMNLHFQQPQYFNSHHEQIPAADATFSMKKEQPISISDHDFRHIDIPPWLITTNSQSFQLIGAANPAPLPPNNFSSSGYPSTGESGRVHSSATALLHKAGDFGATISNKASSAVCAGKMAHNTDHVSVTSTDSATKQTDHHKLSSREELMPTTTGPAANYISSTGMMMTSFSNFANTGFEEDDLLFGGFTNLNSKKQEDDQQLYFNGTNLNHHEEDHMTKDFLSLKSLTHTDHDIFNIAALVNNQTHHNIKTWQN